MPTETLIRLGGLAAMLAGLLRAIASFIPASTSPPSAKVELFYLLIDLLILFGLIGIYAHQHRKVRVTGFLGFLLAVSGTALIVGPDGKLGEVEIYVVGSMLITFGLTLFSVASLKAKSLSPVAPLLWLLSTVVGVGGFILKGPALTLVIAGLAFGLGFIVAGNEVWKYRSQR